MKRYTYAAVAVLLVVFPWRQTSTAQQVVYNVESLATSSSIGYLVPAETGINASGEVVGYVTDASLGTRAVRYTDAVGWEYVPGLTWGSTATGINAHGDIVGNRLVGGFTHAYRYNANTGIVDDILPLTNGFLNSGFAINDNGDVVGQSDVGNGAERGFLARVGLPAVVLPTLGGNADSACGVNSSDQVAMTSTDPVTGFQHAARAEADGVTIEDAGTVDSTPGMSGACAIDDLGHIGGFSSTNSFLGAFHAYRWNPGNRVTADAPLPSLFGNVESIANGMSGGWYYSSVDGNKYAMLHTDANGAVDLNTAITANSGWVLTEIKGINASGQMVGDGFLNGVAGVFRLSPPNQKDTTPPVISNVTATPSTISVVNGMLDPVTVTVSATDDDGKMPTCQVSSISGGSYSAGVDYQFTGLNAAVLAKGGRTYALHVTCSDAAGNTSSSSTNVVVLTDTTKPIITGVTASPSSIWPPALQMVPVTVSVSATDDSGVVSCGLAAISGPGTPGADYQITGQFTGVVKAFAGRTYVFTTQCADFSGNVSSASVNVVVPPDTAAPVISSVSASPSVIWPPDNKMVAVTVAANATDFIDPAPSCALTTISGGYPGDTAITGPLTGNVRAKNGNVYTFTVTCVDFYGNASTASATVAVTQVNGANGVGLTFVNR